jgi:hypothetical protein
MRWGIAALALAAAVGLWWMNRVAEPPQRRAEHERATPTAKQPTTRVTLPAEPEPEPDLGGVRVVGRVVDAKRAPVAGARVTCHVENGSTARGTSGNDGAFRIGVGERPAHGETGVRIEAVLAAEGGSCRVTLEPTTPDFLDIGDLRLETRYALTVLVTHGGKPVPDARVVAGPTWDPTPVARTDAQGRARVHLLPEGEVEVRATAAGCGRGTANAEVPRDKEVSIDLPPERIVALTVVDKGNGKPVAGATFQAHHWYRSGNGGTNIMRFSPPLDIPPTGADGKTTIRGINEETIVLLAVRAPRYAAPTLQFGTAGQTRVDARVRELTIELEPARTIRWPVVEKEGVPVPADGTAVKLRPWAGSSLKEVPASGVMEDGHLVASGWGPGGAHAIATAPDGALAMLWAGKEDLGRETFFRTPRHVEIRTHEPDGAPVAGVPFMLRNQGNNQLGGARTTDAEGVVRFDDLYGFRVDAYLLSDAGRPWPARRVGTVDLDKGSGTLDVLLMPEVDLVVKVRVDGKPAIPENYRLTADGQPVVDPAIDRERGEIRARVRPPKEDGVIAVVLGAPGFAPAKGTTTTGLIELDLEPAGVFAVRVIPPADKRFRLMLEKETERGWQWGGAREKREGEIARFAPLTRGRYRAKDLDSGLTSDAVEVIEGATEVTATLDLTGVGNVTGRIELPTGYGMRDVRIEGLNPSPFRRYGIRPANNGAFVVRVPGNRDVKLRATHPLLTSANEVTVREPRADVVLRLRTGPVATLRLDRAPVMNAIHRDTRVFLYWGAPRGEPLCRLRAEVDETTLRFGGFEPGTYTLWIDATPFVPIVLEGVELGAGETDLGAVETSDGATIRLKVLVEEGGDPPRVALFASALGEPSYTRGLNSRGEAEVLVRGLGPGRFGVLAYLVMGGTGAPPGIQETIESDGKKDIELTLDLR